MIRADKAWNVAGCEAKEGCQCPFSSGQLTALASHSHLMGLDIQAHERASA